MLVLWERQYLLKNNLVYELRVTATSFVAVALFLPQMKQKAMKNFPAFRTRNFRIYGQSAVCTRKMERTFVIFVHDGG
jgi:hypothetical protein